ncbi:MAG: DUF167 domain-containing protein [Myxococcota bacterium]
MAIRIALKVVPGSTREGIAGWLGDALKVRVRAPAEAGRANEAVLRVVAEALALPIDAVRIASGSSSPKKTLEIDGLDLATLRARIEAHLR